MLTIILIFGNIRRSCTIFTCILQDVISFGSNFEKPVKIVKKKKEEIDTLLPSSTLR